MSKLPIFFCLGFHTPTTTIYDTVRKMSSSSYTNDVQFTNISSSTLTNYTNQKSVFFPVNQTSRSLPGK